MDKLLFTVTFSLLVIINANAQTTKTTGSTVGSNKATPVSKADLGVFPYFKTLPNFKPLNSSDSITVEQNEVYFYDGKKIFSVIGQVSIQILNVVDREKKLPSEFQIIQEFDKVVSTLGGEKIYAGKLPEDQLKKISNYDFVSLGSKHQVAPSAYYGVVEYVIKTPDKEVWIQLVPATIGSGFYNLLVVEKQTQLLTTNINKENSILKEIETKGKTITNLFFELDNATLLTESKDEILNIVGIFQAHPDWKLKIEIHSAPIGKPDYTLALTEKRAAAIKNELVTLGIKPSLIDIKGLGDTKPLVSNDTEKGRQSNTRVEINKF
ncbi:MAG: OmpA family protein [Chitinophagaceae bacterium]|nr:OmpA family protein [Chitinophagaceae bacterium]